MNSDAERYLLPGEFLSLFSFYLYVKFGDYEDSYN